jgi:hypothetical protein
MRAMKPCSRFRERFLGWYVLLLMAACRFLVQRCDSGRQTHEWLAFRQPAHTKSHWARFALGGF